MTTTDRRASGTEWRVLAHENGNEFVVENRGTFDELVVDQWLHVEQMEDDVWWLRVGDARLIVTIKAGQPTVDVTRGFHAEQRGSTTQHVPPK